MVKIYALNPSICEEPLNGGVLLGILEAAGEDLGAEGKAERNRLRALPPNRGVCTNGDIINLETNEVIGSVSKRET